MWDTKSAYCQGQQFDTGKSPILDGAECRIDTVGSLLPGTVIKAHGHFGCEPANGLLYCIS